MEEATRKGFASDNSSGVHPEVLEAMARVNRGHTVAYGEDAFTESARALFREQFGDRVETHFVFTGTGANVLSLQALTRPHHAVVCAETAHINEDECGAPEKFTGCKLLGVPTKDGKITVDQVRPFLHSIGFEHHAQPTVISITQATELGTLYRPEEIRAITGFAHENGMRVHMDGARLCNAAAALDLPLRALTGDAGIDVLSFGGTKNGLMFGEAVVFFDPAPAADFKYIRKQGTQLASKMRFMAAQFQAFFTDDLWLRSARHANRMARLLEERASAVPGVQISRPVEANGVFAVLPREAVPRLQGQFFFHVWDEETSEVRWMTSFDTTEEEIARFVALLEQETGK